MRGRSLLPRWVSIYFHDCSFLKAFGVIAGGVAGGDKYLVNDILFKLTVDPMLRSGRHLYGGVEGPAYHLAAKAAAHGTV